MKEHHETGGASLIGRIGRSALLSWFAIFAMSAAIGFICAAAQAQDVLQYHHTADRAGNYIMPGLTPERAPLMHLDQVFDGHVDGHVYAQPLLTRAAGRELLLVATENNIVDALDAGTGKIIWQKSLVKPVSQAMLPCGNIDPLGITATPVISQPQGAIYFDAMGLTQAGPQHLVFGLSIADGRILPGFPVNVRQALAALGMQFTPTDQGQRGALLITGNTLYIPYGGLFGDCGSYHGWVVGIGLDNPHRVIAWRTRASGGGIWAPAGIVSDGQSLFVATGNTFGASQWGDGEAVIRFSANLRPPAGSLDYFTPYDWRALDATDADLGGTNPVVLNTGASHLIMALGKDAKVYLLNRDNLGGIGEGLAVDEVSSTSIITAPAVYPGSNGDTLVAFHGHGSNCPGAISDPSLIVLKVQARPAPAVSTAWCGSISGAGAPIVTTTDGSANPIVWMVGAEGDNRLHAFRGDNGAPLLTGAQPTMHGLRHFATIVAAQDHLYVPADGRIYAFTQ
jgi:outer membrane protein assembly factor BamB